MKVELTDEEAAMFHRFLHQVRASIDWAEGMAKKFVEGITEIADEVGIEAHVVGDVREAAGQERALVDSVLAKLGLCERHKGEKH